MREDIRFKVARNIDVLKQRYGIEDSDIEFEIEVPKNSRFGDFSTNAALVLASVAKKNPREVAKDLVSLLESDKELVFDKIEIAGPGFVNFFLKEKVVISKLPDIVAASHNWGRADVGQGQKIMVEFVSANPTGFLHFGHGRNAVVGDVISRLLEFCGYKVTREFYINDAGRQVELLGESVYCRYRELYGYECVFPEDGYRGDYIKDIAQEVKDIYGESLLQKAFSDAVLICRDYAYNRLLEEIKRDLDRLGVRFDSWYSEKKNIYEANGFDKVRQKLEQKGLIEKRDGALWFLSTQLGDSQDWVLVKRDGTPTYFFSDIVYHDHKYSRGYNCLINVWGADHHSHFKRLKLAMKALGHDDSKLEVILIQFVRLVRGGVEISMSKREGSFVTLREVMDEVGKDVTRFFLLMRSSDSHLDFDLELAKAQSSENPVYYVQYAYARICSIFRKADSEDLRPSAENLDLLTLKEEVAITKKLLEFKEIILNSALTRAPHKLTYYLQELASDFHIYYNRNKVVGDDRDLSSARLYLLKCVAITIRNGLSLLGISAPERM